MQSDNLLTTNEYNNIMKSKILIIEEETFNPPINGWPIFEGDENLDNKNVIKKFAITNINNNMNDNNKY